MTKFQQLSFLLFPSQKRKVPGTARTLFVLVLTGALFFAVGIGLGEEPAPAAAFRAGSAVIDTTPTRFPVKVNGGFVPRFLDKVSDPLSARALVLDDGRIKLAFCVVDACGMNDVLRNEIAAEAEKASGIPASNIMIASTHCHSAPALTLILGCGADTDYVAFVRPKIVEAILAADRNLQAAEVGFGGAENREHVYCRRFLMKPGTAATHPKALTGAERDLAMMNPGMNNPNAVSRTSVPDPEVSVVAIRSLDGRPLALLANYSLHYVGAEGISSDYFGVFAKKIGEKIGAGKDFTAIMTNGTSGDVNAVDFLNPERTFNKETVAESVAETAKTVYEKMTFQKEADLACASNLLTLAIRKPSADDVAEAKKYLDERKITEPQNARDLYAFDTVALGDDPGRRTLLIQAFRIGPLAIAAAPCEVYSFTGLDLKKSAPGADAFIISLANGYFGYIPTVWSFELGGYNTWRARSCCLETEAEPKIRAEILRLWNELF